MRKKQEANVAEKYPWPEEEQKESAQRWDPSGLLVVVLFPPLGPLLLLGTRRWGEVKRNMGSHEALVCSSSWAKGRGGWRLEVQARFWGSFGSAKKKVEEPQLVRKKKPKIKKKKKKRKEKKRK